MPWKTKWDQFPRLTLLKSHSRVGDFLDHTDPDQWPKTIILLRTGTSISIYYYMVNSQASQMNNPALWFVTCEWTTCSYHAQLGLPGAPRLKSVIPFNNSFLTKLASLWWTRVTISLVTLCYKTRDYYTWYPTGIEILSPFRTRSRSELVAHTSWDSKHVSV